MKHFLSYDETGNLQGQMSFTNAVTGHQGWPDEYELDNPNSTNKKTRDWLDSRKNKPAGYVRYDCPCPPTEKDCACAGQYRVGYFWNGSAVVVKPDHAITVDGATYTPGEILSKPPGQALVVLVTADVPDGEKVSVMQPGNLQLLESTAAETLLEYTSGALPPFTLYAPAQGFVGGIALYGKCCTRLDIKVRGWS